MFQESALIFPKIILHRLGQCMNHSSKAPMIFRCFASIFGMFKWYAAKWTHPLIIFLALDALLLVFLLLTYGHHADYFSLPDSLVIPCCTSLYFLWCISYVHILMAGLAGFILLCRRNALGFIFWAECLFFFGISSSFLLAPSDFLRFILPIA